MNPTYISFISIKQKREICLHLFAKEPASILSDDCVDQEQKLSGILDHDRMTSLEKHVMV